MTKINPISTCRMPRFSFKPDAEHLRIMQKLMAYGVTPTGIKSTDIELLRQIELKQAEMADTVSSNFLTVTRCEQEKIQKAKKEKQNENSPKTELDSMQGQKLLGEQIMIAIERKMKYGEI